MLAEGKDLPPDIMSMVVERAGDCSLHIVDSFSILYQVVWYSTSSVNRISINRPSINRPSIIRLWPWR